MSEEGRVPEEPYCTKNTMHDDTSDCIRHIMETHDSRCFSAAAYLTYSFLSPSMNFIPALIIFSITTVSASSFSPDLGA